MPPHLLSRQYAQAAFALAQEQGLQDKFLAELKYFQGLLSDHPELRLGLLHPLISASRKTAIIEDLFGRAGSRLTLDFLRLIIVKRRENILDDIIEQLNELLRQSQGVRQVRLVSARELSPAQVQAIRRRLMRIYGCSVELSSSVDNALLGGLTIQTQFSLLDGSCRGQLEKIRDELSKN